MTVVNERLTSQTIDWSLLTTAGSAPLVGFAASGGTTGCPRGKVPMDSGDAAL